MFITGLSPKELTVNIQSTELVRTQRSEVWRIQQAKTSPVCDELLKSPFQCLALMSKLRLSPAGELEFVKPMFEKALEYGLTTLKLFSLPYRVLISLRDNLTSMTMSFPVLPILTISLSGYIHEPIWNPMKVSWLLLRNTTLNFFYGKVFPISYRSFINWMTFAI